MVDYHPDLDGCSIPALLAHMQGPIPGLRADAACAIGDRLRTHEINSIDSNVHAHLITLLDDPIPMVRLEAAIALAELHDAHATALLLSATRVRATRLDAIHALGTLGDARAIPPLLRIMQSWWYPWADRLQAAAALCALGDHAGAAYLHSKLASKKQAERAASIHFIGESRHPQARALLEAILYSPTDPMRDVAVGALGVLADPETARALQQILEQIQHDPAHEDLRQDIAHVLAQLEKFGKTLG